MAQPPNERFAIRRATDVLGGITVIDADVRDRTFPRHFHDEYTFGLVTRGVNRFRYRGMAMAAPAGTLCIADPGEVHTGDADRQGWSYHTVLVPVAAIVTLAAELGDGEPSAPAFGTGVITDITAVRRFARLFRALTVTGDPLGTETAAFEALGDLVRRHSDGRQSRLPADGTSAIARRVREVLGDRVAESVTLGDLEAATGVGRFRLLRAFRAAHGLPPHAWQVQARLARAHALIGAGQAIASTAVDTGFADQAHLTRLFKRSFGYTPGVLARAGGQRRPDLSPAVRRGS